MVLKEFSKLKEMTTIEEQLEEICLESDCFSDTYSKSQILEFIQRCMKIIQLVELGIPEMSVVDSGIYLEFGKFDVIVWEHLIYVFSKLQQIKHRDYGIGPQSLVHKVSEQTFLYFDNWEEAIADCVEYLQEIK